MVGELSGGSNADRCAAGRSPVRAVPCRGAPAAERSVGATGPKLPAKRPDAPGTTPAGHATEVARLVQEYGARGAEADGQGLVAQRLETRTVWLDMPVAFRVEDAVAALRKGRPDVDGSGRGVVREQVGEALVQRGQAPAVLDQGRKALRAQQHGSAWPAS